MPREPVSFNSSRIQRAYRINNIEETRLMNRLQLLEKERIHQNRVTNQDIRLITITLDYIQSSSGRSPEGEPEDLISGNKVEFREEHQPCFMYGERTSSRRFGKNRRPKSAVIPSEQKRPAERARRGSVSSLSSQSTDVSCGTSKSCHSYLPQSSVASGQWAWPIDKFHTYRNTHDDTDDDENKPNDNEENKFSDEGNDMITRSKKPRAQTAPIRSQSPWERPVATGWSDPMGAKPRIKPSMTSRCQTAPSSGRTVYGNDESIENDNNDHDVTPKRVISSSRLRSKREALHSGKSRLTHIVNQVRVMTTASRTWRNAAKHSQNSAWLTSYTPASSRRQYEAKLAINKTRTSKLDVKVQDFMSKFPMPKHVATARRTSTVSSATKA